MFQDMQETLDMQDEKNKISKMQDIECTRQQKKTWKLCLLKIDNQIKPHSDLVFCICKSFG